MPTSPPGCYGKVPIHGDFIRHNVNGPEIDHLDQWLQQGILSSRQSLGTLWDPTFDASRPQRFLYRPPGGGRTVAGVIAASKDKPGRRFPFLVFTFIDPRMAPGEATVLPAALETFFSAAQEEIQGGWQGKDLKGYLGKLDALALPPSLEEGRKSILTFVAGSTNGSFWSGLFGSADDFRKYLLIHNLVETIRPATVPKYALRIPRVTRGPEVAFWLELCRKLGRHDQLPTFSLWGQGRGDDPGGLTIILDDLLAKYFLPLWWPERSNNLLFPLAEGTNAADARAQQARSRYSPLLDDESLRLSSLLVRLTTT
jgi:type VI secretion system protein ImpM